MPVARHRDPVQQANVAALALMLERYVEVLVRQGRVHGLSDNMALRPGPRAGADVRKLAGLLHPGVP